MLSHSEGRQPSPLQGPLEQYEQKHAEVTSYHDEIEKLKAAHAYALEHARMREAAMETVVTALTEHLDQQKQAYMACVVRLVTRIYWSCL